MSGSKYSLKTYSIFYSIFCSTDLIAYFYRDKIKT